MPLKGLIAALLLGGAFGLMLGQSPSPSPPQADRRLLDLARPATLSSDLQSADIERAQYVVRRFLEVSPNDREALAMRKVLAQRATCRNAFDRGEHALAVGATSDAVDAFSQVSPDCRLYEFARTRLEQIGVR